MKLEELRFDGSDCDLLGFKIAQVVKNKDAKAQERVWVRVIGVHDMKSTDPDYGILAIHCAPSKSNSGEIPDIGDFLWVVFPDMVNPNFCLWLGWVRHST
jgi:hypothetical protein